MDLFHSFCFSSLPLQEDSFFWFMKIFISTLFLQFPPLNKKKMIPDLATLWDNISKFTLDIDQPAVFLDITAQIAFLIMKMTLTNEKIQEPKKQSLLETEIFELKKVCDEFLKNFIVFPNPPCTNLYLRPAFEPANQIIAWIQGVNENENMMFAINTEFINLVSLVSAEGTEGTEGTKETTAVLSSDDIQECITNVNLAMNSWWSCWIRFREIPIATKRSAQFFDHKQWNLLMYFKNYYVLLDIHRRLNLLHFIGLSQNRKLDDNILQDILHEIRNPAKQLEKKIKTRRTLLR